MTKMRVRNLCWMLSASMLWLVSAGCGEDLGACDLAALGGSVVPGMEAPHTGQLVVNSTCAGGRCHSEFAKGQARQGAPAELNFDVVPTSAAQADLDRVTRGEKVVMDELEDMWGEVLDGAMPPDGPMPSANKEAMRNWLACGAPVVNKPVVAGNDWAGIYPALLSCTTCHGATPVGNALSLTVGTSPDAACNAYLNLVGRAAATPENLCAGMPLVDAGKPDSSLLLQKLEGTQKCGRAMPSGTPGLGVADPTVIKLRAWIAAGALPPASCTL